MNRYGTVPAKVALLSLLSLALPVLANGQGLFFTSPSYLVGGVPFSAAAGDLNNDGIPDLAVSNENGSIREVAVVLANDDGTFRAPVNYPLTGNFIGASGGVALGDFNGDGNLDIAALNACTAIPPNTCTSLVNVLLGNGDGTFGTPITSNVGTYAIALTVGDWNRDGKLDLAVVNENDNNVTILFGAGTGGFQSSTIVGVGHVPNSIAAGDFNGDGWLDLAVTNFSDNTVTIALSNANGGFLGGHAYAAGTRPLAVAVGVLIGKCNLGFNIADLAVSNNDGVNVLYNNVDGSFQPPVSYPIAGGGGFSIALADFDHDGNTDIVVSNNGEYAGVLFGNCDGTFQPRVNLVSAAGALAVANFHTGPDLAVTEIGGSGVNVVLNNGSGSFQAAMNFQAGTTPESVAVGDFNGDGKQDMAVPNRSSNDVSVLLSKGNGAFQPAVNYAVEDRPQSVAVGDFNADGKLDFAVGSDATLAVGVLLGNGNGTFQPPMTYSSGNHAWLAVGDCNCDGKPDLVVAGTRGGVVLGNGDGTFQHSLNQTSLVSVGPPALADFNGDGALDVAVPDESDANVGVLLGNGDGTLQRAIYYPAGGTTIGVATVDLNGDGIPDLVTANLEGTTSVLLGSGDGTFQAPVTYSGAGTNPDSVAAGSFGVAVASGNGVVVFLSNGDGTLQLPLTFNAGTSPLSVAAGDLSGNFSTDLAVVAGTGVTVLASTLSGTTPPLPPIGSVSTGSLSFGNQVVGTTSAAQTVTLTNTGGSNLMVRKILVTGLDPGDYAAMDNGQCASLPPGTSCQISVTFTPTAAGTRSATLQITDNAGLCGQRVTLTGTGVQPAVTLSPTSLTFAARLLNSLSPPQTVTLTNSGNGTLMITSIAASGDFSESNTCGASLAAGASCAINVTFRPAAKGIRTGAVSVTDDAPANGRAHGYGYGGEARPRQPELRRRPSGAQQCVQERDAHQHGECYAGHRQHHHQRDQRRRLHPDQHLWNERRRTRKLCHNGHLQAHGAGRSKRASLGE